MELSIKLLLYQIVNFIILVCILGYLFNKFIRPMMKKRSDEIKNSFAEIEKQKLEVEKLKRDSAEELEKIKQSYKSEIEKAISEGNKIKQSIKEEAQKEASALIEKSKKEIEHEKQKALLEVRKEIANLSLAVAKKLIERELDEKSDKIIIENFLKELDKTQLSNKIK
jgi:F-type H+-transporting ATPase subunit b